MSLSVSVPGSLPIRSFTEAIAGSTGPFVSNPSCVHNVVGMLSGAGGYRFSPAKSVLKFRDRLKMLRVNADLVEACVINVLIRSEWLSRQCECETMCFDHSFGTVSAATNRKYSVTCRFCAEPQPAAVVRLENEPPKSSGVSLGFSPAHSATSGMEDYHKGGK